MINKKERKKERKRERKKERKKEIYMNSSIYYVSLNQEITDRNF